MSVIHTNQKICNSIIWKIQEDLPWRDRRIRKTKRNAKQTLVRLLGTKNFDQITVTELCEAADMSRITFYTTMRTNTSWWRIFSKDLLRIAMEDFQPSAVGKQSGVENTLKSYCNLLDCVLNLFESNTAFFAADVAAAESLPLRILLSIYLPKGGAACETGK